MSEKTKLVVFDKKEVVLVFVILIITALMAFALGVKIGKDYALSEQGVNEEDKARIELESPLEEEARVLQEQKSSQAVSEGQIHEESESTTDKRLENELANLEKPKELTALEEESAEDRLKKRLTQTSSTEATAATVNDNKEENPNELRAKYLGKYTIQLGSHKNLAEAKEFANGFKVLGYNPIISEVDLKEKGIWFRVSLEAFDTTAQAKEYIEKEKSLFQGQDYVISKIE